MQEQMKIMADFSRGFGDLETDFGIAFVTLGAETTLTFTLVCFLVDFVRI